MTTQQNEQNELTKIDQDIVAALAASTQAIGVEELNHLAGEDPAEAFKRLRASCRWLTLVCTRRWLAARREGHDLEEIARSRDLLVDAVAQSAGLHNDMIKAVIDPNWALGLESTT